MRNRCLALAAILLAACQGTAPNSPDNELVVSLLAGTAQEAIAGTNVGVPPAVLVTRGGAPVGGVAVQFRVTAGGGVVQGADAVTGPDGIARATGWMMGPAGPQAVEAVVAEALGSPIVFTAVATTSNPVAVAPIQGEQISGTVGLPVAIRPVLRVTDGAGHPIPGVSVSWRIGAGGGGLRYGDPVTGSDGTAGVIKWVLGTTAGENTLVADVACAGRCAPVIFRATGVAGPVHTVTRIAGNAQVAAAGSAVATPPAVRLTDAYGNAAAGRPVTWTVTSGGGMVVQATSLSNSDGIATVGGWTLGPLAGPNALTATAEGVSVGFTATGS